MPYNIGPKIGVDGEAEFRKEIRQITENIKTLGSELKVVASAADLEGESIESLASKNDILNRTVTELEKRLAAQREMLDKAAQKYGEADTNTQKWQRTVNATETELNKLRAQISKNEKAMDTLADGADDAGDAMEDLGDAADRSGGKLDSMTVAMGNLIASGVQAAISGVLDLASRLWNLDEATEEYRKAQGRLQTAFEAAGYSQETANQAYTEFYKILGDTDTATEASQLLARLAKSEEDVATWTEIAAGVSGTFGDSLPIEGLIEAANETANVGTVTGTLADALNWVGISEDEFNEKLAACSSESERNRLIMETLAGQYDEASDAFYRNNEALVQARESQAAMDATLASLGTTISTLKTSLMSELAPALTSVIDAFNGLLNGQDGSQEQFSAAIQGLIATVAEMLPGVIQAGVELLGALVTGIIQAIPALIAAVPEIVGSMLTALGAQLPNVLAAGGEVLDQLVIGIEQGIPNMLQRLPEVLRNFLDYITENLPAILEKGVEMLNSLVSGIIGAIPDLLAALPQVIASLLGFLAQNLPAILQAGVSIMANLITGILSAIPQLVASLPRVVGAIVDGIGDLMSSVIEIGKDIVRGVWQGIQGMISWFTSKIKGFFTGIVDSVLGFLGIHSPSRVFAGIGENMAAGLGVGWDDEFGAIQRQIDRSMAGLVPEVDGEVRVTRGGAGTAPQAADITGAVAAALNGAAVYMDGRKVGRLITRTQNNTIRANGLVPTM